MAGRRALKQRFNVQNRDECVRFVKNVVSEFGRLDVLVNNAAYQQ